MTLIDMAVFLTVAGLLAVPAIQSYNLYAAKRGRETTQSRFNVVDKAIGDFYFAYGRFPCPSNIALPATDPNYGREDPIRCALAPLNGQTVQGGVPFVDLKIPEENSFDGWNNRSLYAVTDVLRSTATFINAGTGRMNDGVIQITGYQNIRLPTGTTCGANPNYVYESKVVYTINSTGPSAAGGFNANGVPISACPTAGPNPPREAENCDGDNNFINDVCDINDIPGPTFYDDVVSDQMRTDIPQRVWVYNGAVGAPSNNIVSVSAKKIGISNQDPWPGASDPQGIDVMGNILAGPDPANNAPPAGNGFRVITDNVCDENGRNCFNPRAIGGVDPNMNCAMTANNTDPGDSTAMTGIQDPTADNLQPGCYDDTTGIKGNCPGAPMPDEIAVRCEPVYAGTYNFYCPNNQYAVGVNADGTLACAP